MCGHGLRRKFGWWMVWPFAVSVGALFVCIDFYLFLLPYHLVLCCFHFSFVRVLLFMLMFLSFALCAPLFVFACALSFLFVSCLILSSLLCCYSAGSVPASGPAPVPISEGAPVPKPHPAGCGYFKSGGRRGFGLAGGAVLQYKAQCIRLCCSTGRAPVSLKRGSGGGRVGWVVSAPQHKGLEMSVPHGTPVVLSGMSRGNVFRQLLSRASDFPSDHSSSDGCFVRARA